MSGLWWVKAHTQGKVISEGKKDLGFDELAQKWTSAEQTLINQSFQSKMDKKSEGKRSKKVKRKKEPMGGLPRWFIYVTYTACFIFCAIASWFTILYGLKFEPAIGRAYFRNMRQQGQVIEDPLLNEYIQDLGNKLSSKVQDGDFQFNYFFVPQNSINAFAMPGARICHAF